MIKEAFYDMMTTRLEWAASLLGLSGAAFFSYGDAITGYMLFVPSSLLFIVYSLVTKQSGLLTLNLGFAFFNIHGLYHWYTLTI